MMINLETPTSTTAGAGANNPTPGISDEFVPTRKYLNRLAIENGATAERARSTELECAITRRIIILTGRQIRALAVQCLGNRIAVNGFAPSYYQKQLALQGVLDTVLDATGLEIDLGIEVANRDARSGNPRHSGD